MKYTLVKMIQVVCLLKLSLAFTSSAMAQAQLDINFDQTQQEIDNFGASAAWSIDHLFFSTDTGLGLSAWRFNVGAGSTEQGGDSNIGDRYRRAESLFSSPTASADASKQTGQIRFLKEAHERGVKDFVAFSNSPPTWATKNGLAHPGNGCVQIELTTLPIFSSKYCSFCVVPLSGSRLTT